MLSLREVSAGYGDIPITREVTLDVAEGEVVALVGRNGVGKSTLAKAIVGLLPIQSGKLMLAGADVTKAPAHVRARSGIGYVPQGREVFATLSIEDNLKLGAGVGHAGASLDRAYQLFPFLKDRSSRPAGILSGGQQQMLAIGRILAGAPRVLILDEPSDGIQPSIVEEIGLLIARLNAETGLTALLIEQNVDLIVACARRCLIMEKGAIVNEVEPLSLEDPEVARRYLAI
jgi:ABC-type branched-subunit amino acid transport system ATPase component